MRRNQLKSGIVLSYCTQIVHILTGLIYTPIMLRLLGKSEYGLYQLVASVVSYLSLLSLGFGAGYIRFYSRYKAINDEDGIAKINGMFLIIFGIIAAICILCGGAMTLHAEWIFGSGLNADELKKARVLLAIMVINMALSFISSVFTSNITAQEKFFFQRMIIFLKALLNPFLTLPLLIMGLGSISMVLVTTVLTLWVLVTNIYYCIKKLKMKFSFRNFDFSLLKEMWTFTFFIFINLVVDQINWSVDKLLLGRMVGTAAVALYGVAGQLNSLYTSMSTSVSSVFIPRVNMLIEKGGNKKAITELFIKVGRVQAIIMILILSGYIVFGKQFIFIWAGEGFDTSYQIGLFLMIPVTIPLIQNLGIEIQRAKNMHKARSFVYLAIAISNIFISIPFIEIFGATGAAVGTAISLFVGNGLFMNWYYHRRIGIDIICFWKEIGKMLPAMIASMALGFLIQTFFPTEKILFLGLAIVCYVIIYFVLMWFFAMNKSEKQIVYNILSKIRRN